jgi:hypothetical protein
MEDHRSQYRRQKKKKVEIYTYQTATGSAIENAAPRLVITATGSAIEMQHPASTDELKCKIIVSDRRTYGQLELI